MSQQDHTGVGPKAFDQAKLFQLNFNPTHNSVLSLVAGPFADRVIKIWGKDRVHEYLAAPDARRHVWNSWLAAQPSADDAYTVLSRAKSSQIVQKGYGLCPAGMVSTLGRLGPASRTVKFYPALFKVIASGGPLAQWLFYQKEIPNELVFVLSQLDDDGLSRRAVSKLIGRSVKPRLFRAVIWLIRRLVAQSGDSNAVDAVLNSNDPVQSARKLAAQLPFPPAPWRQLGSLEPVESPAILASLGKSFRNCLSDRNRWIDAAISVQSGRRYYYYWTGEQPALLMFARCGALGWSLQEAAGPSNTPIHPDTEMEIQNALCSIPNIWPIDLHYSSAVMFDDF